jgi:signal transduction histidine kinase
VLLSGAIGESAAVDVMREGISDYLLKDHITRLPHVVSHALEVHEARLARRRAAAELAASERRLADLTEHLQTSTERERASIAREIHDDIGGSLTSVKFDGPGSPAMRRRVRCASMRWPRWRCWSMRWARASAS